MTNLVDMAALVCQDKDMENEAKQDAQLDLTICKHREELAKRGTFWNKSEKFPTFASFLDRACDECGSTGFRCRAACGVSRDEEEAR